MKAVVLAGGKGTRLAPYTKILPKPMMPIGDLPILEILLRQMKRAGIDEAILTVGHLAELMQAFFQNGERFGLPIRYSFEEQPLGTAGPLALVEGLDATFLVTNGDVLTNLDLRNLIDFHRAEGGVATIAMHERKIKIDLGVIQRNGGNAIIGYIEKPTYEFHVSMGIYVFEPRVLAHIPRGQYFDFPDLVLRLIEQRERVIGYPFDGYWQDLGRADDYEQAIQEFETLRPQILGEG
ncbi:MAG: NTP transferase domain-containing protein [Chloroflexi bacterium]|nr:NTP transferase domain-containing protein [Chloroflexota bacterium]